jgi:hypothetical protein
LPVAAAGPVVEDPRVAFADAHACGDVPVAVPISTVDEDFPLVSCELRERGEFVECLEHGPSMRKRPPGGRPVGALLPLNRVWPGRLRPLERGAFFGQLLPVYQAACCFVTTQCGTRMGLGMRWARIMVMARMRVMWWSV